MNSDSCSVNGEDLSPHSTACSVEQSKKKAPVKYSYNLNKDKKPKRNKSAFILFSIQARLKIKAEAERPLNSNEIMVRLADQWKNLPEHERRYFELEASKDKKRYHQELESFWKNNPAETLQNRTKKNHVKKPCSAYGFFLRDVKDDIKQQHPELKMADVLKVVSERWKNLEDEKKIQYQQKAKQDEEQCREKLGECIVQNEMKPKVLAEKKKARHQNLIRKQAKVLNSQTSATSALITNQNTPRFFPPNPLGSLFFMNLPSLSFNSNNVFPVKQEFTPICQPYTKVEQNMEHPAFSQFTSAPRINPMLYTNLNPLLTAPLNFPNFPKQQAKQDSNAHLLLKFLNQQIPNKADHLLMNLFQFNSNQRKMSESTDRSSYTSNSNPLTPPSEFGVNNIGSRGEVLNDTIINALNIEGSNNCIDVKNEFTD